MLIHVTIVQFAFFCSDIKFGAIKDGLDVIFIWTLIEKKDCSYKELDSVKAGKMFYCVNERCEMVSITIVWIWKYSAVDRSIGP